MPRAPRFARAVKSGSTSNGKRSMKGNNRFGSKGCMKCDECRRRKTRCEFDPRRPNEPCRDCKRRGTNCGKALPAQTHGRLSEYSNSSLSPSPSDVSSPLFDPAPSDSGSGEMESQNMMDTGSVSLMLQNVTDYAYELQSSNPSWSRSEILAMVRISMEAGHFGEFGTLLNAPPPSSPPRRLSSIVVKPHPEYHPYPTQYARQATPPLQPSAGTVNPLQLTVEPSPHFSYTDALNRDESPHAHFDSETAHETEYGTVAPYNYDIHEPYTPFPASMRYPVDHREFVYPIYR